MRRNHLRHRGYLPAVGVTVGALAATLGGTGAPAQALPVRQPARTVAPPRPPADWRAQVRSLAVLHTVRDKVVAVGPDPRLAHSPLVADHAGWARQRALDKAAGRLRTASTGAAGAGTGTGTERSGTAAPTGTSAAGRARTTPRRAITEHEAAGTRGGNETPATAESFSGFSSRRGRGTVDLTGDQAVGPRPALVAVPPSAEDDGMPRPGATPWLTADRPGVTTTGLIGDNPPDPDEPDAIDIDLYALDLTAGQLLGADLRRTSGTLDPLLFVLDAEGDFVADSLDSPDPTRPSIAMPVRTTGRYWLGAVGMTLFDERGGRTPTTGDYALDLYSRTGDLDTFAVRLAAGDVLGTSVSGSARFITLRDPRGVIVMGSDQDASGAYPTDSPLPGGGRAVADTVAPRAGSYTVTVSGGDGPYRLTVEAYRPGGDGEVRQTVFLDLDGERLNTNAVFGRGVTTLSPLSDFLPRWGLAPTDRRALGRRIRDTVEAKLRRDLERSGLSRSVAVRVVTSDDGTDRWGRPGVMRVVVGGTVEEAGVETIGIAPTIDPGNFDREETALVLLDLLSSPGAPGVKDSPEYSLNSYLTPTSDRVGFVGRAIGTVVAHEVGHTLGNFHTDNSNDVASVMDAGGEHFETMFGVGPDRIGGTSDDVDVRFVADAFAPFEGFTGMEDTLARSTWALSR